MGYETKLIIGRECSASDEYDYSTEPARKTGKKETYFMSYAEIDLCKAGTNALSKAMCGFKNKDKNHHWYFYGHDGNTPIKEDKYGDKWIPQTIDSILEPMKIDYANGNYRRFKWAIALLESMKSDNEEIKVLIYSYKM